MRVYFSVFIRVVFLLTEPSRGSRSSQPEQMCLYMYAGMSVCARICVLVKVSRHNKMSNKAS